ncbi:hypothetical protein [Salmonella phage PHA46]
MLDTLAVLYYYIHIARTMLKPTGCGGVFVKS